jgi:hypothetical protein
MKRSVKLSTNNCLKNLDGKNLRARKEGTKTMRTNRRHPLCYADHIEREFQRARLWRGIFYGLGFTALAALIFVIMSLVLFLNDGVLGAVAVDVAPAILVVEEIEQGGWRI